MSALMISVLLAMVIAVRVVCVLYHLDRRRHHRGFLHFSGFGYSYVILGVAAFLAVVGLAIDADLTQPALWGFLLGSAGLIVFDRRTR